MLSANRVQCPQKTNLAHINSLYCKQENSGLCHSFLSFSIADVPVFTEENLSYVKSQPFADLLPAAIMQGYVVLMFLLVLGGTLLDVVHKKAPSTFSSFAKSREESRAKCWRRQKSRDRRQTAVHDVALSGEFCNAKRRVAHLLGMYGFVIFLLQPLC